MLGSSNPVGTGTSLNVVGDHIFGNNQAVVDNSSIIMFDHTNGAYYAVVEIAAGRNMKSTAEVSTTVIMDGEEGYESKFDNGITSSLTMPFGAPMKVLIPPYARFQLQFEANDAADTIGCTITGRIYA